MLFMASILKECIYRKPNLGLWNVLFDKVLEIKRDNFDKTQSFYCGDAAGRKQKPFNDFSNDDLLFSINLGIKFYTPEMLFLDDKLNFKIIAGTVLDEKYIEKKKTTNCAKSKAKFDFY